LIQKGFYAAAILLGVTAFVFWMFQGLGDPARMLAGQSGDAATLKNIRRDLRLDEPAWKQFLLYLNDVSPLSLHSDAEIRDKGLRGYFIGREGRKPGIKLPYLRTSYQTRKPVLTMLMEALPGTLLLASAAMLFACFAGIALGILAAVKKGTWWDTGTLFTSVAGISAPSFFMAMLIAYLFGVVLHSWTGLNLTGSWFDLDPHTGQRVLTLRNLWLPALTLGIRPLAIITQLTRSAMLDVLQQDYIRTARAKGLSNRAVLFRHALPNALNPVITAITGWFAELLAGAFFVEYIFGWQGLGKLTVDALEKLDYPVVMGSVWLSGCIFIIINFLSDALQRVADPRVRA
jgi:peptide/nickel transport system permease protein